jgi:hypothetical protein
MQTYLIRRRSAWSSVEELERAAGRSTRVGAEEMPDDVRWIRTYVVSESDGRLGSVCVYQATGEDAVREHARRAELLAEDIVPVVRTVLIRDDPPEAR